MMNKWIVFLSAFLLGLCFLFFIGGRKKEEDVREPLAEEVVDEPGLLGAEEVVEITPYRYGFLRGQRNFMLQMGLEDVPSLPPVARYASSESSGFDSEEEGRGYVDGYHRAADMMYCPRCTR